MGDFAPTPAYSCEGAFGGALCGGAILTVGSVIGAEVFEAQNGRLRYDAEAAVACLSAPWANGCSGTPLPPDACGRVFTPAVADGGSCDPQLDLFPASRTECLSGGCQASSQNPCEGRCGACDLDAGTCPADVTPAGQPCSSAPCEPGSACVEGLCRVTGSVARCQSWQDCPAGQMCSAAHACVAQVGAGMPCTSDAPFDALESSCQPGLVCQGLAVHADGTGTPGVCAAPIDVGGRCVDPVPGFDRTISCCATGLACSCGTCVIPPAQGPALAFPFPCRLDMSYWSSTDNTCQPLKSTGSLCDSTDPAECASTSCLNGTCAEELTTLLQCP